MSETDNDMGSTDALSSHLLYGKKHHDEEKNVPTDEVHQLEKGADYLTTFLLQQGIKKEEIVTKKTPPKLEELKKIFVKDLVKSGFVTVDDKGRTVLTDSGNSFLDNQTKNAAIKVELAKLKNLEFRKKLARKIKYDSKKIKKTQKRSTKKK